MFKKFVSSLFIMSLLVLAGCSGGSEDTEANFGDMMGEIACLTLDFANFSEEAADAVAVKYGFGDWTEDDMNEYLSNLTDEEEGVVRSNAVEMMNTNCAADLELFETTADDFVDLMLAGF